MFQPFLKVLSYLLLFCVLKGCGSTASLDPPLQNNKKGNLDVQFSAEDIAYFDRIIQRLEFFNNTQGAWQSAMREYAKQEDANALARYSRSSSRLHDAGSRQRCNKRNLVSMKNSLDNNPSSLPILSYALECAERFERTDQQTIIANAVSTITKNLVANSGKGNMASAPIEVREIYEGIYLLNLAGIDVFETEMLVEDERILMLHHAIDELTQQYSLSFTDHTSFFNNSINRNFAETTQFSALSETELTKIRTEALIKANHYGIDIWNTRNKLLSGDYLDVINHIKTKQYNSPVSLAMLSQAYMESENMTGISEIIDDLAHHASLGIVESQAVVALMLLKLNDGEDANFKGQGHIRNASAYHDDIILAVNTFNNNTLMVGAGNSSLIWVRVLLADGRLETYLPQFLASLSASSLKELKSAVLYIRENQNTNLHDVHNRIQLLENLINTAISVSI